MHWYSYISYQVWRPSLMLFDSFWGHESQSEGFLSLFQFHLLKTGLIFFCRHGLLWCGVICMSVSWMSSIAVILTALRWEFEYVRLRHGVAWNPKIMYVVSPAWVNKPKRPCYSRWCRGVGGVGDGLRWCCQVLMVLLFHVRDVLYC